MLMFIVHDNFLDLNLEGLFHSEEECREFYAEVLDDFPAFINIVNVRPATEAEVKNAETRAELIIELQKREQAQRNFKSLVSEFMLLDEFPKETRMQLDNMKQRIDELYYKLGQLK